MNRVIRFTSEHLRFEQIVMKDDMVVCQRHDKIKLNYVAQVLRKWYNRRVGGRFWKKGKV